MYARKKEEVRGYRKVIKKRSWRSTKKCGRELEESTLLKVYSGRSEKTVREREIYQIGETEKGKSDGLGNRKKKE